MAIDYGVYSLQKPVPAVDPEQIATSVLNQQTLIAKGQQQQQQMADDAETRRILQQYGGDKQHVIDALRAKGLYAPADAIEKADIANRNARADAMKAAIEGQQQVNQNASSFLQSGIDDPSPENLAIVQARLNALPLGSDDTDQDRQMLNQQLTELRTNYDPAKVKSTLQKWHDGLLSEKDTQEQHLKTTQALLGPDALRGAAEILSDATDAEDYGKEYQAVLSAIPDRTMRASVAATLLDPSQVQTPEQFALAKQKAKDISTTNAEKASEANSKAIREQAAASAASLEAYRQSELGIRRAELGVTQAREAREEAAAGGGVPVPQNVDPNAPHGTDFLKTLPETEQNMVRALAEGRQPWPSAFALKTPYWQKLMGEVFQYDPTFDTATASNNARVKVRQDFTSGKSAQQVNAINTVAGHLATLADNASKLNNSNFQTVNWLKNLVKTETGSSDVTNFNTAKEAVASELTRVWRQAGGSEQDIKDWKATIDATQSPEQLKGAFSQIGGLIESKLQALQDQYQQGMGITKVNVISPEARASLDKLEGKAAGPNGKLTEGHVYNLKDGGQAKVVNGQLVRIK